MYNDMTHGGVNMVDISSQISSIRAAWVPRFLKQPAYFNVISSSLKKETGLTLTQLLQTNFKSIKTCSIIGNLTEFYQDVFIAFNECKSIKSFDKMNSYDYFAQPIWCNELFKVKNKCICFKTWIKSGIVYVKDLFKDDGTMFNDNELMLKLCMKNNWMVELLTLKKAIGNSYTKFDTKNSQCVNIKSVCILYHGSNISIIQEQRSSFFYEILRKKYYVKPYIEKGWEKSFSISRGELNWEHVYTRKVKQVRYHKFSEFNFKLLHNIVPCGKLVSKWDQNTPKDCLFCNELESSQHMLFECRRVKHIWDNISKKLKINIKWRHIVIGYDNSSLLTKILNLFINIISFSIYKEWIICKQKPNNTFATVNLYNICINALRSYQIICDMTEDNKISTIYKHLFKKIT